MRWLHADPNRPDERRNVESTVARIDAWWRELAAKVADLDSLFAQKSSWDLPGWMHRHLQAIDPRLMWEFGPPVHGRGHRLVITPESERWLRPLTSTLLERAPKIDGWEFYAYRLAENVEQALASVKGRAGLDLADATVEIVPDEDDRRIGLRYSFAACRSSDDDEARGAAFVATESLLGEDVLDRWIGAIEVAPRRRHSLLARLKRPAEPGVALAEVRGGVMALVDAIRDALPSAPCIDRVARGMLHRRRLGIALLVHRSGASRCRARSGDRGVDRHLAGLTGAADEPFGVIFAPRYPPLLAFGGY